MDRQTKAGYMFHEYLGPLLFLPILPVVHLMTGLRRRADDMPLARARWLGSGLVLGAKVAMILALALVGVVVITRTRVLFLVLTVAAALYGAWVSAFLGLTGRMILTNAQARSKQT